MSAAPPIDTLRLTSSEYAWLIACLGETAGSTSACVKDGGPERRADRRFRVDRRTLLLCRMANDANRTNHFALRCYDLSRGGMSFFHGHYIHVDTACDLTLITADRRGVRMAGHVVRCAHVRDHVHQVGIRFDQPLDLDVLGTRVFTDDAPAEVLNPLIEDISGEA